MQPVIVGVDPGSTSAVAIIDFEGEILRLESGKNFPPREIIAEIVEEGKPMIVSCDKAKMPSKVEKIANSVGAKKFSPEEDLSQGRKRELGEGKNSHEMDAVASARYAFKQKRGKVRKVEKKAKQEGVDSVDVAERIFLGKVKDNSEEDRSEESKVSEKNEDEGPADDSVSIEKYRKENERLKTKVSNLKEQVSDLKEKLKEEEEVSDNLRQKYYDLKDGKKDELLKDREISRREGIINDKEEKIEKLEKELKRTKIRERQYEKALELIEDGAEMVPVVEEVGELPEKGVTRSREVRDNLRSDENIIYHVDEVEGVELHEKMVVREFPEENLEDILKEYRESR